MECNFGENDYIDEEDDIDGECYIDAGEADYDKLFNSDWCPLLGRMPEANNMDDSSCENLSVGIISNARKLWGIKPMRIYTPTDNINESTDDKPKELHKYPKLRLDAAHSIARTYPKVNNEAAIAGYQDGRPFYTNTPLDVNWERAVEIVKKSLTVRLNEQIKDYHILSILAIAEAWDVLKSLLYHGKSEDNRNIVSQVRVPTALLGKAKELFLVEKNKQSEREVENAKNNMWKIIAGSEGVDEQSNKTETTVYDWRISETRDVYCNEQHIAKLPKLQFALFKCLYKNPGKYIRNKTLEECWGNKLPNYIAFLSDTMGELNAKLKKGLKDRHITIKNRVIESKQKDKKNVAYKLVT